MAEVSVLGLLPPTFCGDNDSVENYIQRCDAFFHLRGFDEKGKLSVVVLTTKGVANECVTRLIGNDTDNPLVTYTELKSKLLNFFKRTCDPSAAYAELSTKILRPNQNLRAYAQEVISLCIKADPTMPETKQVGHIINGLPIDVQKDLKFFNTATISEVLKKIEELEVTNSRLQQAELVRRIHGAGAPTRFASEDSKEAIKVVAGVPAVNAAPQQQQQNQQHHQQQQPSEADPIAQLQRDVAQLRLDMLQLAKHCASSAVPPEPPEPPACSYEGDDEDDEHLGEDYCDGEYFEDEEYFDGANDLDWQQDWQQ